MRYLLPGTTHHVPVYKDRLGDVYMHGAGILGAAWCTWYMCLKHPRQLL